MFKEMTDKELSTYINGCHARQDYDSYFEAACRELNDRRDKYTIVSHETAYGSTITLSRDVRVF